MWYQCDENIKIINETITALHIIFYFLLNLLSNSKYKIAIHKKYIIFTSLLWKCKFFFTFITQCKFVYQLDNDWW